MGADAGNPVDPTKTALLIMDYQNGAVQRVDDTEALLAAAKQAVTLVRERGGAIGYVRVGFAMGSRQAARWASGSAARRR